MRAALPLVALIAAPAAAEVKSAGDQGFEVSSSAIVRATPAQVYAALGKPGQWWSSAHSWSGDVRNMTLSLTPGGCFCERLPAKKGAVEHGHVIFAAPGQMLRLRAALGPLQAEGISGTLTWTMKPVDGGAEIVQTYVVGGYIRAGMRTIAPPVDAVLAEQLGRLKAYLEKR